MASESFVIQFGSTCQWAQARSRNRKRTAQHFFLFIFWEAQLCPDSWPDEGSVDGSLIPTRGTRLAMSFRPGPLKRHSLGVSVCGSQCPRRLLVFFLFFFSDPSFHSLVSLTPPRLRTFEPYIIVAAAEARDRSDPL